MDQVTGATTASRGDRTDRTRSGEHVERIVVALRDAVGGELLLQRATALAGRGGSAELFCVHVVRADGSLGVLSDELVELRRLTAAAGTGLHTVLGEDVPEALLQFARDVGATQLVLGVDPGGALRPFRSGRVGAVVSAAAALDVHLVPVPALDRSRRAGRRRGPLSSHRRVLGWLAAVTLPPIVSVIGVAAGDLIGPTSAALAFMLAVVGVALIGGLGAAVLAAVGATMLLNYFFTPPLHSLAVVDPPAPARTGAAAVRRRCWWRWSCTTPPDAASRRCGPVPRRRCSPTSRSP